MLTLVFTRMPIPEIKKEKTNKQTLKKKTFTWYQQNGINITD